MRRIFILLISAALVSVGAYALAQSGLEPALVDILPKPGQKAVEPEKKPSKPTPEKKEEAKQAEKKKSEEKAEQKEKREAQPKEKAEEQPEQKAKPQAQPEEETRPQEKAEEGKEPEQATKEAKPAAKPAIVKDPNAECEDGPCCENGKWLNFGYACLGVDDGHDCTVHYCGKGHECIQKILPGYCLIEGECVKSWARKPGNSCRYCNRGISETAWSSLVNGTWCDDENACTRRDRCKEGECVGESPIACGEKGQCFEPGRCNPETGICEFPPKPDGTSCTDDNACTYHDQCKGGECKPKGEIECLPLDFCYAAGECDPKTGKCSTPLQEDGASCFDQNLCTMRDECLNGECIGMMPKPCKAPDACHLDGVCDPDTGECSFPLAPDGTACDDQNPCTQTDTCVQGECKGANPIQCEALDDCHVPGVCDPQTGQCTNPPKADGSPCESGRFCFLNETCEAGVCTGGDRRDCSEAIEEPQCQIADCDEEKDICTAIAANENEPCDDDGSECTEDFCQAGRCAHPLIPNDCDNYICGRSKSDCHYCGGCIMGEVCEEHLACEERYAFISIPAETFMMGSPETEIGHEKNHFDETLHQVTLTYDYELMREEVTQGGFEAVMGYNPSFNKDCGADCPVERVSWHEAAYFANKFSELAGLAPCYMCENTPPEVECKLSYDYDKPFECPGYRLPTEAEWELAARGGTTTAFYSGDIYNDDMGCVEEPDLNEIAWYCANANRSSHPVGKKGANLYGLYDMSGNVTEWVGDWYGDYESSQVIDPAGPYEGKGRVARGGSWYYYPRFARSASRRSLWPGSRESYLGFRLARTKLKPFWPSSIGN